ncbi:bifunctional folylpolyglutamate synthase/dihydrofolate synthase [Helcococcus kunzii]
MKELITMDDYLDWMYQRGAAKDRDRTVNIRMLLEQIGNPQDKLKIIHIAGTNGKGSTANFLASTLSKTTKCGLFVSPYMDTVTDSFKINGVKMTEEVFKKYIDEIRPLVDKLDAEDHHITYFEVLTTIMFKYFYDQKVDIAVVEVGLGGKFDATNVIESPLASVIVTISMDHINVLGDTIEEIAEHKAGIIKQGRPVFVYPQAENVFEFFENKARESDSELFTFTKDEVEILELSDRVNRFNFREYKNVKSGLIGEHQLYNASLAIMVLDYFKDEFNLTKEDIYDGINKSTNLGRLQLVNEKPRILFDGSHNAESIDILKKSLKAFKYDRLIFGFSMLKDKDFSYVISQISEMADEIIVTTINYNGRSFTLDELTKKVEEYCDNVTAIEDRYEAYEHTKSIAGENDLVVWCGSLYMIRDLLGYLNTQK